MQARSWTIHLSFSVAFATLFAKIWRLYKIFLNKTLTKRVSIAGAVKINLLTLMYVYRNIWMINIWF